MTKIAIDIVLLPSEDIMDKAIAINTTFSDRGIALEKQNTFPHISLCMGVLDNQDLGVLGEKARDIAPIYLPLDLTIDTVETTLRRDRRTVSVWHIKKTTPLQSLHESIMKQCLPYLSSDAKEEMLAAKEIDPITLEWISDYATQASFDHFKAHITLGFGEPEPLQDPITFTASRIAICLLGDHCTCQKILWQAII
jgi:hypothetical protein